ncbi:methyl-accepting chemotaxis protein [Coleofasciculus sp. FACHB-1120]|uniref:methyl-accepting chemotaxis protein n=1 Tax=Coleofasciculus sp. FACHB-1120 TaxID=2692783 RepID=UPI001684FE05|nr:methyl-accepting chemotaxis protein [Coleofasciculus sp. FACHB-1120]MBD2742203.1 HAMP domain-containing protein [Coleofasciculus sp. FACHB-1120]
MKSSTDYTQEYQHAFSAYTLGNYEEAAAIIDRLVENFPDDPNARILRGHIYCYGLQQYAIAREQYELVPQLTDDQEFIDCAHNGIEYALSCQNYSESGDATPDPVDGLENPEGLSLNNDDFAIQEANAVWPSLEEPEMATQDIASLDDFDSGDFQDIDAYSAANPFVNSDYTDSSTAQTPEAYHDPFAQSWSPSPLEDEIGAPVSNTDFDAEAFPLDAFTDFEQTGNSDFQMPSDNFESDNSTFEIPNSSDTLAEPNFNYFPLEDETLLMRSGELDARRLEEESPGYDSQDSLGDTEPYTSSNDPTRSRHRSFETHPYEDDATYVAHSDQNGNTREDQFDFEAFDDAIGYDSFSSENQQRNRLNETSSDFLDEFGDFGDDLGSIPDFDLSPSEGNSQGFSSGISGLGASSRRANGDSKRRVETRTFAESSGSSSLGVHDDEFSITGTSEQSPGTISFTPEGSKAEPNVTIEQGPFAAFENAPLSKKPLIAAAAAGIVSAVVVALVSFISASAAPQDSKTSTISHLRNTSWVMSLAAGAATFGTTLALGRITTRQIKKTTEDLHSQFDSVSGGNFNAQATVYSEDEFGALAAGFNQMARVILTTTSEAQRKAEEQEQAKEDLQRQVIRLLDDVEGAARGDLTVQAEVTADVLGAVADSFNLTIQNLREIVQQVKMAARQVSKGATDSEVFARGLSSDALRQAEELAVTLNSVQVMTGSIQRVAENAREAEEVARAASATALKGGESVERTVAGILQIRETVAETTRKVKRLAESSQEISKIVALISGIASRTNLLALNASIEAARAGEAGRGFAVVADEVRQLADRAAKALKEIEQIVLQIQSETGSVMMAMEEGTQQVIDGTKRAEQAKRSLEDIIQVSNRIDALVRSITADTVEQTETSSAVAQVMQSVELTAQETSQEAQRVSTALQNLVGVARDLLTSVERFRIEATEGK